MSKRNTSWSTPKTNLIEALWSLKKAFESGYNARLIKLKNEDCDHPIKSKEFDKDFRNFEFKTGLIKTRQEIIDDKNLSEFEKYLTLNYCACYGTKEAVDEYYVSGNLSLDNFKGMGVSHLINVDDIIRFYSIHPDKEIQKSGAKFYIYQYKSSKGLNTTGFFDHFNNKLGSAWGIKNFKRKLWVVELLDNKQTKTPVVIKFINWISYPLNFIPKKTVLKMETYTKYCFRIGGYMNGFEIEIQIPKKFSLN
jgi:hypothetical protein